MLPMSKLGQKVWEGREEGGRGVATGVDIGIYTPKISPSKLFIG